MHDREWDRLVEEIGDGECTPFLGAGACSGTLPTAATLSRAWAARYQYPFGDKSNLPEVMQYAAVMERSRVTVKKRVVRELSSHGEPNFTDPVEPHALLARLSIPVYLTTNYDEFMSQALRLAGKRPATIVCPWWYRDRNSLENLELTLPRLPRDYWPRIEEPLVYHLHGSFRYPASLVLAQQDYVEFLVNLAMDRGLRGMPDQQIVPIQALPALTRQPLLFIGYSLRDWSFRMLFHGLIKAESPSQHRRHVSVQLSPLPDGSDPDARRRAEVYFERYFEKLDITVHWGSARDFCTELGHRLGVI